MTKPYDILTILLILIVASCKNEADDIFPDINGDKCIFLFDKQKSELSSYWLAEDTIGITAYLPDREELCVNSTNRRYQSNGNGVFVPVTKEDMILRPLAGNHVDFIAYYPYKAGVDTTYAISLGEQSNQKQLEVLYSNNAKNITNTSGNVKLTFDHVLSKIVINTTLSSGSLENKDLHNMRDRKSTRLNSSH